MNAFVVLDQGDLLQQVAPPFAPLAMPKQDLTPGAGLLRLAFALTFGRALRLLHR